MLINAVITARCGLYSATCSVAVNEDTISWSDAAMYYADGDGVIYSGDEHTNCNRYMSGKIRLKPGKSYAVENPTIWSDYVFYNSSDEVISAHSNVSRALYPTGIYIDIPEVVGEDIYLVMFMQQQEFNNPKIVECEDAVWTYGDGKPVIAWRMLAATGEITTVWKLVKDGYTNSEQTHWHNNQQWMTMHKIAVNAGQTVTISIAPNAVIAFYAENGNCISNARNSAATQTPYSQVAPANAAYAVCLVRNYGGVTRDTAVITVE